MRLNFSIAIGPTNFFGFLGSSKSSENVLDYWEQKLCPRVESFWIETQKQDEN